MPNLRSVILWIITLLFAMVFIFYTSVCLAKTSIRKVDIKVDNKVLIITSDFKDIFTKKIRKKMTSGLPTKMLVQVVLVSQNNKKDIRYWAQSVNIVYDLWEENFAITVSDNRGKRRTKVKTIEEVINIAGTIFKTPVITTDGLKKGSYRLKILAEINPISDEMILNIRRWISRPVGGYGGSESRVNFFGSFVGHFVNRDISKADKAIFFVSQWFKI